MGNPHLTRGMPSARERYNPLLCPITKSHDKSFAASGLVSCVELGAEDASRADKNFLFDYCATALEQGVHIINIADTLGIFSTEETYNLIQFLRKIPRFAAEQALLSVHCHNDLGLACANTLAAISAGCSQIEVSVLGAGERAGNASLEEVCANLEFHTHYNARTNVCLHKLHEPLKITACASSSVSLMKPLAGWNSMSHASGIHQQGLRRNADTYTHPMAKKIGFAQERIVLSKHSGKAGIALFAIRYCATPLDKNACGALLNEIKNTSTAPDRTTGITEFLCLLYEKKLLKTNAAAPLVCVCFNSSYNFNPVEQHIHVSAKIERFHTPDTQQSISGKGHTVKDAVLAADAFLTDAAIEITTVSINGFGKNIRLYAEITVNSNRVFAIERQGGSPEQLLFLCCLDAINATSI
jgi:2-isopropylmalate synthase